MIAIDRKFSRVAKRTPDSVTAIYFPSVHNAWPRIRVTVDRKAVKIGGLWPPTLFSQRSIGLEGIAIRLFLRFTGLCARRTSPAAILNFSRGYTDDLASLG